MGKDEKSTDAGIATSRRSFLTWLWVALGCVAVAEVVWMVSSFLRPRKPELKADAAGGVVEAGPVGNFEPGTVTAFQRGFFYLARLEDGGFLALSCACTHLGCTVPWVEEENRFVCPCHSSVYDITGNVLGPPATRPLDRYPVRIENNIVKVDLRSPIRRSSFNRSQVVYS